MKSVDLLELGDYDDIRNLIDRSLKAGTERDIGHEYIKDIETRYRENNRSNKLLDEFNKISSPDKFLVLVGNKYNTDFQDRIIYRFVVPDVNGKKLVSYLKKF